MCAISYLILIVLLAMLYLMWSRGQVAKGPVNESKGSEKTQDKRSKKAQKEV